MRSFFILLFLIFGQSHGIDLDSIDPSVFDELAPYGIKYTDILRPENIGNLTFQHQIDETIKKINLTYFYLNVNSYYISEHKFWEFDWRISNPQNNYTKTDYGNSMILNSHYSARATYMMSFPDPPIINLYPEVVDNCEISAFNCIEYIGETTIINRGAKFNSNSNNFSLTDTYKDLINTFEDVWQLFNFRATASYYLCWFTLSRNPLFKKINRSICQISNMRTEDFKCAEESFCPDPCCGKFYSNFKQINTKFFDWKLFYRNCEKSQLNPCYGIGSGQCRFSKNENNNFEDLKLNKFNITCDCPSGFIYSNEHKICVDIDECLFSTHNCKASENESCLNLSGTFKCICATGFLRKKYNKTTSNFKCIEDLIIIK